MTKTGIARIVGECVLGGGCIGGGSAAYAQTSKLNVERANRDRDIKNITDKVNKDRNQLSGARNKVNMAAGKVRSDWNAFQDCVKGSWSSDSWGKCNKEEKSVDDAVKALDASLIGEFSSDNS